MKICTYGLAGVTAGRHNLKDQRLDAVHQLVEADKKAYAQVDVVGDDELADADAIVATSDSVTDLLLRDLEFVEIRLGREAGPAETEALKVLQADLEASRCLCDSALSTEAWKAVNTSGLITWKPVVVAPAGSPPVIDSLLLAAFSKAGYICYLTVGGKENRAWPIRKGITIWAAAAAIHSDIQKGFIRAEVIAFDDLIATGGEVQAKRAGKLRLETKQYVAQDYDVVNFRFNKT